MGFSLEAFSQPEAVYRTGLVPWRCCSMNWLVPGAFLSRTWWSVQQIHIKVVCGMTPGSWCQKFWWTIVLSPSRSRSQTHLFYLHSFAPIEAPWSFKTSGTTKSVTVCHITEDVNLPQWGCENLRSQPNSPLPSTHKHTHALFLSQQKSKENNLLRL